MAQGEVNHWQVLNADEDVATMGAPYQIEAGFHFKLNGEYYGGYLRSVAMTLHEAETKAQGEPKVNLRYNPANPDETAVLARITAGTCRSVSSRADRSEDLRGMWKKPRSEEIRRFAA